MSKFTDTVAQIKEHKNLEGQRRALMGANMSHYISGKGPDASAIGDIDNRMASIVSNVRSKMGWGGTKAAAKAVEADFKGGSRAGLVDQKSSTVALDNTWYDNPSLAPNRPSYLGAGPAMDTSSVLKKGFPTTSVMDYRRGTSAAAQMLSRRLL